MRGASLASLSAARTRLGPLAADGGAAQQLAAELFALVDALDATPAAARALANPNRSERAKRDLVAGIMAGHDAGAIDFAQSVAVERWSRDRDLADGLEQLAIEADLAAVEAADGLELFETQVFGIGRFLAVNRAVRTALADEGARPQARAALAQALFGEGVAPGTRRLVVRLARAPRGRTPAASLELLGRLAAERRGRLVATAITAVPLSPAQSARLAEIIARAQGSAVQLNVTVDPAVIGGLRIRMGDEVVDATVLTRLAGLRRAVAG
jgi:F-type H+-transporting ATPase subunit delta